MCRIAWLFLMPLALAAQIGGGIYAAPPAAPANSAPPTKPEDLCTVEGQVSNAVTGEPVKKASLLLIRADAAAGTRSGGQRYTATSDAGGRFAIQGVEPGQYRFLANRSGFLNTEYGATGPGRQGTLLSLERGRKVADVVFRLTPNGVITGRILDEDGDPLENVQVQLLRFRYNQGKKQLMPAAAGTSNDVGEYRISGIAAGKYYLNAASRGVEVITLISGGAATYQLSAEQYVPTFYPGTTEVATAVQIDVPAGTQVRGIDLRLAKAPTVRIKGRVVNNTGTARQNLNVMLVPRDSISISSTHHETAGQDGNFELSGVAPGSYLLVATVNASGKSYSARQPLEVANSNVEGVTVAVGPGVTLSGRLRLDGDAAAGFGSVMVRLAPRDSGPYFGNLPNVKVNQDGTFKADDVNADRYGVQVGGLPDGFYVKAMRSGNVDVMAAGLDLSSGTPGPLDIVVRPNAPQVAGTVQNSNTQQPAPRATVVLIPQEPERREQQSYYRTATADASGHFSLRNVPPGDYQAYAWEEVEYGAWMDPDFLKPVEGKGEGLTLREGDQRTMQLVLIPAEAAPGGAGR